MFEVDVKNVTEEEEGREGEDQARFFTRMFGAPSPAPVTPVSHFKHQFGSNLCLTTALFKNSFRGGVTKKTQTNLGLCPNLGTTPPPLLWDSQK